MPGIVTRLALAAAQLRELPRAPAKALVTRDAIATVMIVGKRPPSDRPT